MARRWPARVNYEIVPRLVVGVEGDIDWSNIQGSVSACSSKTATGVIDCATRTDRSTTLAPSVDASATSSTICSCMGAAGLPGRTRPRRLPRLATVPSVPKRRMCSRSIAPCRLQRPTVGRPGVDLSGASFRIGRFGSNTSICNSAAISGVQSLRDGQRGSLCFYIQCLGKHWCRSPARRSELSVQLGTGAARSILTVLAAPERFVSRSEGTRQGGIVAAPVAQKVEHAQLDAIACR